tara:strand:+ start:346 stop:1014 length:669 start_codon:yes stop_codon:yes gene_type:complete
MQKKDEYNEDIVDLISQAIASNHECTQRNTLVTKLLTFCAYYYDKELQHKCVSSGSKHFDRACSQLTKVSIYVTISEAIHTEIIVDFEPHLKKNTSFNLKRWQEMVSYDHHNLYEIIKSRNQNFVNRDFTIVKKTFDDKYKYTICIRKNQSNDLNVREWNIFLEDISNFLLLRSCQDLGKTYPMTIKELYDKVNLWKLRDVNVPITQVIYNSYDYYAKHNFV